MCKSGRLNRHMYTVRQCINVDEAHRKNLHKNPLLTQYGETGKKKANKTLA